MRKISTKNARLMRTGILEAKSDVERHVDRGGKKYTAVLKMRYNVADLNDGVPMLKKRAYFSTFARLAMERGAW